MKIITVTEQTWTGMFNEKIEWYNRNLHVDEILSVTPKEIYVEDLTLLSHFEHDSKFLKALGSEIETNQGSIITLQSPDEIDELILQSPYELEEQMQRENNYDNLRDYINRKTRSYPPNTPILKERDKQAKTIEKKNKIIKHICLFMLVTFIIFSIIYPHKSYELVNDGLASVSKFFTDMVRVFFGGYM